MTDDLDKIAIRFDKKITLPTSSLQYIKIT